MISINKLQSLAQLRRFLGMMTFESTIGFSHLRRTWIEIPGWVDV